MRVDDVVFIGSREFVVEAVREIQREALLRYKKPNGDWRIYDWVSFDEFNKEREWQTLKPTS
jgi:hypothetical protein